ncbi:hypothetical protein SFRURICE_013962 [Spodoptera frugiperda]|nr:hypothetical protein SFRURICE_013962 [Spodoptera frugiperda]
MVDFEGDGSCHLSCYVKRRKLTDCTVGAVAGQLAAAQRVADHAASKNSISDSDEVDDLDGQFHDILNDENSNDYFDD